MERSTNPTQEETAIQKPAATLGASGSLIDLDASFLPVGHMRLLRVNAGFHAPVTQDATTIRLATEVCWRAGMYLADVHVTAEGSDVASVEVVLTVLN